MKLYQLTITIITAIFLTACGNGDNRSSQQKEETDNITFYENADKSINITWEKTGTNYKVLAIEKNQKYIKIYETTSDATYRIVCLPLNTEDDSVVFTYKVYEEDKLINDGEFTLEKLQGFYSFTLGDGNSFEDANFSPLNEEISTNGLDIEMRHGQYKLLDNKRTPKEYIGYFLLLENNILKGKEYINSYEVTFEAIWKYDRLSKIFILDNTANNGGYAKGKIYGNSNEINVNGYWNNGNNLDAKFIYMNDSRVFTEETNHPSKLQEKLLMNTKVQSIAHIDS